MEQAELLSLILDSWDNPVVFADCNHIIRYMNSAARKHYARWGDIIGKSVFDCHNDNSSRMIKEKFQLLEKGAEEVLYSKNEKRRIYMRGVRDKQGNLVGYYERYLLSKEG